MTEPDDGLDAILDEIEALHAATRPDEWVYRPEDEWGGIFNGSDGSYEVLARGVGLDDAIAATHRRNGSDPFAANARFVVAAHRHLPRLVEALHRRRDHKDGNQADPNVESAKSCAVLRSSAPRMPRSPTNSSG